MNELHLQMSGHTYVQGGGEGESQRLTIEFVEFQNSVNSNDKQPIQLGDEYDDDDGGGGGWFP